MPVIGVVLLILGFVINTPNKFQVSTGWLGFFVFTAAFFVLFGVERLLEEHH